MQKNKAKIIGVVLIGMFFGCAAAADHRITGYKHTPNLCDLDGGRWCTPCGHAGEVACPALKDEGWLCCSAGVCVAVASASDCTAGISGWCANYTVEEVGGSSVATCHDGN